MAPEDVTLGELARGLVALEGRINDQFAGLRSATLHFVTREVYDIQVRTLNERITDLEDRNRWIARTAVAAFLFPVLVAVVVGLVVTR